MIFRITLLHIQHVVSHYYLTAGLHVALGENNGGFQLWFGKNMFVNENMKEILK